MSGTGVSKL